VVLMSNCDFAPMQEAENMLLDAGLAALNSS
jgi:hypothetical protein